MMGSSSHAANLFRFFVKGATVPLVTLSLFALSACESGNQADTLLGSSSSSTGTSNYSQVVLFPSTATLTPGASLQLVSTGGIPPYTYAMLLGTGSVSMTGGLYVAPMSQGTGVVKVTDAQGSTALSSITISIGGSGPSPLTITPATKTLAVNNSFVFSASGGVTPYSYSVVSGGGTIGGVTGIFSATSTGSATVRVTDAVGGTSDAAVTINSALVASPNVISVGIGNSFSLSASGGIPPYNFSVVLGGGTVTGTTYTAPGSAGAATARVTDSGGNTADYLITINGALAISPTTKTLAVLNNTTFSATGGVTPYTYSVVSGGAGGAVNASTGVYTAPGSAGGDSVRVTDALGNTSSASVSIQSALVITPASVTIALNNTYTFTASGGVPPYTYAVTSGVGSISALSGVYSGSSTGSGTIRVTDSLGNTSTSAVTVSGGLVLAIDHSTLAIGNIATLSASGGVSPYTYSVISGGGSIGGTTFTAPASAGSTTLRVTDNLGNTNDAVITTNAALAITPTSRSLTTANTYTFVASNGVGPYTFTILSGVGAVGSSSGIYTSASTGSAVVKVTDALSNTATASVTVLSPLAISPTTKTLTITNTWTFSASGGVTPYVYSVSSGIGSINSTTGVYTAPGSAGSATVTVTDAIGNTSNSAVTVNANLAMSPATYTMAVNNTNTFTGLGGVPPYTYTIQAGGGSVNGSGLYTAPAGAGSATVKVTDAATSTATASVTINAALAVSPGSFTLAVSNQKTITISGGVTPYSYSSTVGSIASATSTTAIFTAPASAGSGTITVTDAVGNTYNVSVTVNAALAISPTSWTGAASGVTRTFTATGGSGTGYTYSTTIGSINSSTGVLTPPATTGTGTVTVTDSLSNTATASITINGVLAASPTTKTLAVNNTFTLSATGGVTPYAYSITAGSGSFSAAVYTAPSSSGSATLRVTDAVGNTANCTVTINAVLSISPTTKTLAPGNSQTFTASGGVSPYAYSAVSGTMNASTGFYTAPGSAGSDTVTVTDALGNTSPASVTINPALTISPSPLSTLTNDLTVLATTGGVGSVSYSVPSGGGGINSGLYYIAPSAAGSATVRATDTLGNQANSATTISTMNMTDNFQYQTNVSSAAMGMAVVGNTIYVTGYGNTLASSSHWITRKSTDAGATWSTVDDYQYSASQAASGQVVVANSDASIVYVAGYGKDAGGIQNWIVRKTTDGGTTWSVIDTYQYVSGKATIATSGVILSNGDVYVSGTGTNSSNNQYLVTRKLSSGTWTTVDTTFKNQSGGATDFQTSLIYVPGGIFYNAFACYGASCFTGAGGGGNLMIRKSTDGTTWSNIYTTSQSWQCSPPAFGVGPSNGYLYMGFRTRWDFNMDYYYSTDGGISFPSSNVYNASSSTGNNTTNMIAAFTPNGDLWVAGSEGSYATVRHQKLLYYGSSYLVESYQMAAGFAAGYSAFITDSSGHLYVAGQANDSSSILHWIFKKF